jgi:undecaprenyl-diphosphatase
VNWDTLIDLDRQFTLWLNSLSPAPAGSFWLLLSDARIWFPAYGVVMALLLWRLGWKRGLVVVASLFVTVLLADQLSGLVKHGLERLRPCYDAVMLEGGLRWPYGKAGGFFGFFSSHAGNCFGFAVTSFLGFRWNDPSGRKYHAYGWGVFLWAALVSLSRVMLAAHFFGDVLAGAIFGMAVGLAVAAATRWIIAKAL